MSALEMNGRLYAADDYEEIAKRVRERAAMRGGDPRRAEVCRLAFERGIQLPGAIVPDEVFLAAGYSQAELDEMKAEAEKLYDGLGNYR